MARELEFVFIKDSDRVLSQNSPNIKEILQSAPLGAGIPKTTPP
jgi:hypothetical protein